MTSIWEKTRYALLLILLLCQANLLGADAIDRSRHDSKPQTKLAQNALKPQSVYQLNSHWVSAQGKELQLAELQGKAQIVTMAYTSCQLSCSMLITDMIKIQSRIPPKLRDQVGFVMFSLDPERDTPERLSEYASSRKLESKDWTFLSSSADSVRELSVLLNVSYQKDTSGEYAHSNVITLLDQDGVIRYQQLGLKQDAAAMIDALLQLFAH